MAICKIPDGYRRSLKGTMRLAESYKWCVLPRPIKILTAWAPVHARTRSILDVVRNIPYTNHDFGAAASNARSDALPAQHPRSARFMERVK